MPIQVQFDVSGDYVALRFTGSTSFEEWRAAIRSIVDRAEYRTTMCWLSDRRSAADIPVVEYIRLVADFVGTHTQYFQGCGWAVVTPSSADFGMARMAEILSGQHAITMRVFRDYDEAIDWIRGQNPKSTVDEETTHPQLN